MLAQVKTGIVTKTKGPAESGESPGTKFGLSMGRVIWPFRTLTVCEPQGSQQPKLPVTATPSRASLVIWMVSPQSKPSKKSPIPQTTGQHAGVFPEGMIVQLKRVRWFTSFPLALGLYTTIHLITGSQRKRHLRLRLLEPLAVA